VPRNSCGCWVDVAEALPGPVTADASNGGLARRLFAVAEHLVHECPEHDRGRAGPTEPVVVLGNDVGVRLSRETSTKGSPGETRNPAIGNRAGKTEVAMRSGIVGRCSDKTLPDLTGLQPKTGEGFGNVMPRGASLQDHSSGLVIF